jgi:hypothetical protein
MLLLDFFSNVFQPALAGCEGSLSARRSRLRAAAGKIARPRFVQNTEMGKLSGIGRCRLRFCDIFTASQQAVFVQRMFPRGQNTSSPPGRKKIAHGVSRVESGCGNTEPRNGA